MTISTADVLTQGSSGSVACWLLFCRWFLGRNILESGSSSVGKVAQSACLSERDLRRSGHVLLSAGDTTDLSHGGQFAVRAGSGAVGGAVELLSGEGTESSGGAIVLSVGRGNLDTGGAVNITAGQTLGPLRGGTVDITGGQGGFGGALSLTGGKGAEAAGGSLILKSGSSAQTTSGSVSVHTKEFTCWHQR